MASLHAGNACGPLQQLATGWGGMVAIEHGLKKSGQPTQYLPRLTSQLETMLNMHMIDTAGAFRQYRNWLRISTGSKYNLPL
jgi:hypothetical protein